MKGIVIFLICIICFSIKASAETELIIATGELPQFTSVDFNKSFLAEIFNDIETPPGRKGAVEIVLCRPEKNKAKRSL